MSTTAEGTAKVDSWLRAMECESLMPLGAIDELPIGDNELSHITPKQAYRQMLRGMTAHPLLATRPLDATESESKAKPLEGGGRIL